MIEKKISSKDIGDEFEIEVLNLFVLMGYEVKRNILLNGRQIDIYAEKVNPPLDKIKIAIECKNKKSNVDISDTDKFFAMISPCLHERSLDRGFIISKTDFTAHAKLSAERNGIQCLTYSELLRNMVNFNHYIRELISDFRISEVCDRYINLDASQNINGNVIEIEEVEKYIKKWVNNEKSNHLSILGEYGSGKTTLCNKIAHDFALEYEKDPIKNRIPILINLRDYSKAMNLKQLITDLLVNTHRIQGMTNSIFKKMNDAGKLILIFDGFDEMAQKVNFNITVKNFEELAQTTVPPKSKVILTCRTEYFKTNREEREVLSSSEGSYIDLSNRTNFEIIHLKQFSLNKIKEFLEKVDPESAESYFEKIRITYNLYELSQRPVLLDMIVKSIKQITKVKEKINAGKLYEVYTNEWLKRDVISGRTILPKQYKYYIVNKLAQILYKEGKMNLHFLEINKMVKKEFNLKDRQEIDYYEHDIRTCGYLIRDDDGNYKFVHKSFMEFFVAKGIVEEINEDNYNPLKDYITPEIKRFISNLIDEKTINKLWNVVEKCRGKAEHDIHYIASNCVTVLKNNNFPLKGSDLSNLTLPSCDMSGCDLSGTDFSRSNLKGSSFINAILNNTTFNFANLTDCEFAELGNIQVVLFGPTDSRCVYGTSNGLLKSYDIRSGIELATTKAHERSINAAFFGKNKQRLFTGGISNDGTGNIREWRPKDLKNYKELTINSGVTAFAYNSENKYIIVGDASGNIYIINQDDMSVIKKAHSHKGNIISLEVIENGKKLISSGEDTEIILWDLPKLKHITQWKKFGESHIIGAENDMIYFANSYIKLDSRLKISILEISNNKFHKKGVNKTPADCLCNAISFRKMNDQIVLIVVNTKKRKIEIIHANSLQIIHSLPLKYLGINSIDISKNDKYLIAGFMNGTVIIYDLKAKKVIRELLSVFSGKCMSILGVDGLSPIAKQFLLDNGAVEQ